MKHFIRETLEVDKVQLSAFKAGLKSREFVVSLVKNPPKTMAKMLWKTQKYMNDEDTLAAIKGVEKPKEKKTIEGGEKWIRWNSIMLKEIDEEMTKILV